MSQIFFFLVLLTNYSMLGQNIANDLQELGHEEKIAEKSCLCLSKLKTINDAKQAIVNCNIQAKNEVRKEDLDKIYKRDYTVEGIRRLNKTVTDLLIENCDLVSIDKSK
ncbi:MAG: hypothetical protein AAFX53_15265 [Bacteroidota bacterium]